MCVDVQFVYFLKVLLHILVLNDSILPPEILVELIVSQFTFY